MQDRFQLNIDTESLFEEVSKKERNSPTLEQSIQADKEQKQEQQSKAVAQEQHQPAPEKDPVVSEALTFDVTSVVYESSTTETANTSSETDTSSVPEIPEFDFTINPVSKPTIETNVIKTSPLAIDVTELFTPESEQHNTANTVTQETATETQGTENKAEEQPTSEQSEQPIEEHSVIAIFDQKGALWKAIDYVLFGTTGQINTESAVAQLLYNSNKANLIRTALEIRRELQKPETTIVSEAYIEEVTKQTLDTIDKLCMLQYHKLKPIIEEQAHKLVTENHISVQEAKDRVYSGLVARLALDWLLLGLTQDDVSRIKKDEILSLLLKDYVEAREQLFEYVQ